MRSALFIFSTLLISLSAHAEYRVFEHEIVNLQSGASRQVTSTLDDIQYRGYYRVSAQEKVQIKATWMCKRRADGFMPLCPNPNPNGPTSGQPANQERQPASDKNPKSSGSAAPALPTTPSSAPGAKG